jgi:hypothetical protein
LQALGLSAADYKLASLRCDLWKLRAKALIEKIPHSRRYQLLPNGYPDLRALPQVVRKALRSAHRWHFAALRR